MAYRHIPYDGSSLTPALRALMRVAAGHPVSDRHAINLSDDAKKLDALSDDELRVAIRDDLAYLLAYVPDVRQARVLTLWHRRILTGRIDGSSGLAGYGSCGCIIGTAEYASGNFELFVEARPSVARFYHEDIVQPNDPFLIEWLPVEIVVADVREGDTPATNHRLVLVLEEVDSLLVAAGIDPDSISLDNDDED